MGDATSHTKKDYETLVEIDDLHTEVIDEWYSAELSRTRVYPQDISTVILLTPDAVANTFGNWTLVIPANLIPFDYTIHSFQSEGVGGADSFFVQFALNAAPAGNQYLGEKRFTLGAAGRARLTFSCPKVTANGSVYARVKTAAGTTTINITVAIKRFITTAHMDALLATKRTTWPW